MGIFNWLTGNKGAKANEDLQTIATDVHSHLLPGIDDGSSDLAQTLKMVEGFVAMGISKAITTPHILRGFYDNTPAIVREKLAEVQAAIATQGIPFLLEAAAEYYFDEHFVADLVEDRELLTFGSNYLLFETSFTTEPLNLVEMIAEMKRKGYHPVFAHPERYQYLNNNWDKLEQYFNTGVLFQLNAMSLEGYYDPAAKRTAEKMVEAEMVHLVGSDCHKPKHQEVYKQVQANKYYKKLQALPLLNHSL